MTPGPHFFRRLFSACQLDPEVNTVRSRKLVSEEVYSSSAEDADCVHAYIVQHVAREGTLDEDVKFIGVFSSRQKAEGVIEKLKVKQGFLDFPDNFYIDAYKVDQDHWSDGFTRS